MRKIWPWLAGLIVFLVLGLIILFGAGFLQNRGYLPNFRFVQGGIAPNGWHHHGFGLRWGLPFIGILGGLLLLIIPGGLIALIVLGIYLIARPGGKKDNQFHESSIDHCPSCGEEIKPGWHVCPYCGENLGKD
jgi:hypothetical protein